MNFLLYPLSAVYDAVTSIRNRKYDTKSVRPVRFDLKVISVGNLSVGGTGKTPFVEFLIERIQNSREVGVLSRGYGRKTSGPIKADENATAKTIGDEPMQYHTKYNKIEVVVSEQRVFGVPFFEKAEVVILDDAYQHRGIHRDLNIMLSDFNKPFFKDDVLPLGRLRENRKGAKRADIIIFTKVLGDYSPEVFDSYISKTKLYSKDDCKILFSEIGYGQPYNLIDSSKVSMPNDLYLMTSIANPTPLVGYLESQGIKIVNHYKFRDHYSFTEKTISRIENEIGLNKTVVITEKDAAKLKPLISKSSLTFLVVPIVTKIMFDQEEQLQDIINGII
ncbi:tetraacyldisaccharide 4'-kinase [Flammeovirga kamogawensis]|uniref:Tetraacyldisaccharide 4'-kinase n=1 Tax=Flammeovirga kamogawensis TaxID=373891 RepID=A0ABX8GWI2_9BACT|nr:tetraacyldisaccharide 4'-kinase [Flammeovirga kamogawensis]MBB6460606.1 tetraacyldisaccharide 4'-kinase [Flammeovirga kamogawensis]QWG07963.1 tetraacyldisaccharide 4'-kinase [Flammeovirga kamogawensis]TRX69771.1 tetraacyldisaccharide 4'-kinase [Flammeovirga kamogawensis]